MGRTLGGRVLDAELGDNQQNIDGVANELARPRIHAQIVQLKKDQAETELSTIDRELEDLIDSTRGSDIRHPSAVPIAGFWCTNEADVGSGKAVSYHIGQEVDSLTISQEHPEIGLTLKGKGLIDDRGVVSLWYATITGSTGLLELRLPDLIVDGAPTRLSGSYQDFISGIKGRITIYRKY